jgi:superfamily II DNA or RNA helicase
MKILTIANDKIILENISSSQEEFLRSECKYTNMSTIFEIKRLKKSYYMRQQFIGHPKQKEILDQIETLKKKIYGSLFSKWNDKIILPSGLLKLVDNIEFDKIIDNRKLTGDKISLPYKKPLPEPRDYQKEAIDLMQVNNRGIINLAMGLGKSLIAIHATKQIKTKTLIVVPTESIAKQFYEEMVHYFGEEKIGIYYGKTKKIKSVTIGIANSVNKNIEIFKESNLGLVIFDEAHRISSDTFFEISSGLSYVGKMFGLTATNFRSDGLDILIGAYCGQAILEKDIRWGIENGWLAQPHFIIRNIHSGVYSDPKEKLWAYKAHVIKSNILKNQIMEDAKNMLNKGLKVLVIVQELEHGKELSAQLGVPFAQGSDKNTYTYIKQMGDGKIQGLVGTAGVASEGVNIKCIDVLILATFAKSEGAITQSIGRAMRKTETKDKCIIIDYNIINSTTLSRYCKDRIGYYSKITNNIKYLN